MAPGDRVLDEFLAEASRLPPDELPTLAARFASVLGVDALNIWLADYQQRTLVPTPAAGSTPLSIEASVAGRAYSRTEVTEADADGHPTLWLPMIDGIDRIGVLEAIGSSFNETQRDALVAFTRAVTAEIVTRGQYTDAFQRVRRRRDMTLSAELQWQQLPPTTFQSELVSISGVLEPAYDIAGDSFDYAYNDGILHFMIMDAVGHDLGSSFYASLAVGAYRHARRDQLDLDATVKEIDRLIAERFEQTTYVTAQLCELDVATGILQWVNAGHPSPMLVRNGRVIGDIEGRRRVPLGLGYLAGAGRQPIVAEEHLEPNDSLLFYSDGVVEARTAQGEDFGIERLKSFVESAIASRLSSAEITRRLSHAVLDHHGGRLQDDATVLLVNWRPDGAPA